MNKDRVEGKMKDVAGRVERQAGEWTNVSEMQVKGAAKQAEGKAQNAVGQVKDAVKNAAKLSDDEDSALKREESTREARR